jgi:integrase
VELIKTVSHATANLKISHVKTWLKATKEIKVIIPTKHLHPVQVNPHKAVSEDKIYDFAEKVLKEGTDSSDELYKAKCLKVASLVLFLYDACARSEDAARLTWTMITKDEESGTYSVSLPKGKTSTLRENVLSNTTIGYMNKMFAGR